MEARRDRTFHLSFCSQLRRARVSVEAEFRYRVVAKELEREQPAGDTKSHIYIFERPEEWQ